MSRSPSRPLARATVLLLLAGCASSPQAAPPQPSPSPSPSPQAAPASAPAPTPTPAPASAAGVYDFTTSVQGTTVTGVVTVTARDGRTGGTIATSATPEIPVRSATVEGRKVTVTGDSPDGEVVLEFNMSGQDFSGTWWYGGQSGSLTGRRR